jgi:hypothetical protein
MEEILKKEEQVKKARNLMNPDITDIAKFGEASDQEEQVDSKDFPSSAIPGPSSWNPRK